MAADILATSNPSDTLAGATEATEFGAAMRDMRLAHKADLETVASTLRIRQVYLQAIEDGRFTDLPGPTYAAGFVRAYAEFLGLDIPETMRRYREAALGSDRQAPLVAPSPVVEGTMPTGFILLVAAVLAAIGYGSWYYLSLHGRDVGDIVAQIPQQMAEIVGLEATAPEPVATPSEPAAPAAPAAVPAAAPAAVPALSNEDESTAATAAEAETQPSGQAPAQTAEQTPRSPEPAAPAPDVAANVPTNTETPPKPAPETPVQVIAEQQEEPATTVISSAGTETRSNITSSGDAIPAPVSLPGPAAPVAGAAAEVAENAEAPVSESPPAPDAIGTGAGGLSGRSSGVETTMIPAQAPPTVVIASPDRNADQSAALPVSPTSAVVVEPASRVVLRATAISWVELRDANGKRVFSRLLKKGETYNVPGRDGITLATGNAGALDILVDGQTIGPLGPLGAVRRDVLLEPAALLQRGNAQR